MNTISNMTKFKNVCVNRMWFMVMLGGLAAGCGGGDPGQDEILGGGGNATAIISPTVTAVVPLADATGVSINSNVTAAFSRDMDSATISTSTFTLACPAGTSIAGAVSFVDASRVATFNPTDNLPASTLCTATITTGAEDTVGTPLVNNFVWTFRTGVAPDTTRPRVTLTVPDDGEVDVATNTAVTATFTEDMDPTTFTDSSFTLTGPGLTVVDGNVTYAVSARTATFDPDADLPGNTLMTATVTTDATDLAGNALAGNQAALPAASDFVWTFTTGAAPDTTAPTITLTNPADEDIDVAINRSVNATFSEAMDPLTITDLTFTLQETGPPLGALIDGIINYDVPTDVATFDPNSDLQPDTDYTATVTTDATDLAGNALAPGLVPNPWTFTTAAAAPPPPAFDLGSATPFGTFGGTAGMTNAGNLTIINGDIGSTTVANAAISGFHDAADSFNEVCPGTPLLATGCGLVNGTIFSCAPSTTGPSSAGSSVAQCDIASQARLDADAAFIALSPAALPGGLDVADLADCPSCGGVGPGALQLGGRTIPPGVYTSATTYDIDLGGDVTLDGEGDPNAVWVFQMGSALNVGTPGDPLVASRSVILINGAQAKNVFWQVGSTATINPAGGGTMEGNIIADSGVAVSTTGNATPVTVNGRLLSLIASVTLVNTIVNVPAP